MYEFGDVLVSEITKVHIIYITSGIISLISIINYINQLIRLSVRLAVCTQLTYQGVGVTTLALCK